MKRESLVDFMFVGVAVIPGALAWFDEFGLAMIAFAALMLSACLCGLSEQIADCERDEKGGKLRSVTAPPAFRPHTLQRRDERPNGGKSKREQ